MLHGVNQKNFISVSDTQLSSKYEWPRPRCSSSKSLNRKFISRIGDGNALCSELCCHRSTIVENTGFHNLEPRILLIVFSHFTGKELSAIIFRVCRQWYKVARDPYLWRVLEFKDEKVNTNVICSLLQRTPKLETLTLNDIKDPITVIRQMCRCNGAIKHLNITNCRAGPNERIPESVLRNILHCCCNLESLNLKGTWFSASRFFQELANLPKLRKLNLSQNKYLRSQHLMTIALNCRSLRDVSITWPQNKAVTFQITDPDVVFFFNNLSRSLKCIEFDTIGLSAPSFQAILSCQRLEKLSLHHAHFLTGDILCKYASQLSNLKQLRLTQARQLVSDDFIFLSKSNVLNNLTLIDLAECWKICNNGLRAILQCCKDRLIYLNLKTCKLINDVKFIVDNCSKLEYLNIAYTLCPKDHYILNIPVKMFKLRTLVLDDDDNNNASNDLLMILRKEMPNLVIHSESEFYKSDDPTCVNADSD